MNKLRILISAYACEPNKGSEPGIGWNWVMQLSKSNEVIVLTRKTNSNSINNYLMHNNLENVNFIFIDLPQFLLFWKRGKITITIYYIIWQLIAYNKSKTLIKYYNIDLIHHVTFGIYWLPSFLWKLNKPFIFGSVGGGEDTNKKLLNSLNISNYFSEITRVFIRDTVSKLPSTKKMISNASMCISTTSETFSKLSKLGCRNNILLSHVGLSDTEINSIDLSSYINPSNKLRLISAGVLKYWKGFDLVISAIYQLVTLYKYNDFEYLIYGSGKEYHRLKKLIKQLKLEKFIFLKGNVEREIVQEALSDSYILLHPSFHDSGGYIIIEAMAKGVVPIVLKAGFPGSIIDDTVGKCIDIKEKSKIIEDLAESIFQLIKDRGQYEKKSYNCKLKVINDFSWEKKGILINDVYKKILNENPTSS